MVVLLLLLFLLLLEVMVVVDAKWIKMVDRSVCGMLRSGRVGLLLLLLREEAVARAWGVIGG